MPWVMKSDYNCLQHTPFVLPKQNEREWKRKKGEEEEDMKDWAASLCSALLNLGRVKEAVTSAG